MIMIQRTGKDQTDLGGIDEGGCSVDDSFYLLYHDHTLMRTSKCDLYSKEW
jgi:hypothetical protein